MDLTALSDDLKSVSKQIDWIEGELDKDLEIKLVKELRARLAREQRTLDNLENKYNIKELLNDDSN